MYPNTSRTTPCRLNRLSRPDSRPSRPSRPSLGALSQRSLQRRSSWTSSAFPCMRERSRPHRSRGCIALGRAQAAHPGPPHPTATTPAARAMPSPRATRRADMGTGADSAPPTRVDRRGGWAAPAARCP